MGFENIKIDYKIGEKIYKQIPLKYQLVWACEILKIFERYIEVTPKEINDLIVLIENKIDYKKASKIFGDIRGLINSNSYPQLENYLSLVEKVAKITYNHSGASAPYDSNSGYYIPMLAQQVVDTINNKELKAEIYKILVIK